MRTEQLGEAVGGRAELGVRWQAKRKADGIGRMPGHDGEGAVKSALRPGLTTPCPFPRNIWPRLVLWRCLAENGIG